ncbi:MAG: hypothetical protein ACMXYK_03220 [Candidatus Woesearchaeota archaeon]
MAPAIVGLVISLVEIFFVMQDEGGMHPLTHGLHAVPTCLIFTYIAMNAIPTSTYLANQFGWTFLAGNVGLIGVPIAIGVLATIKVKAAAAIIGGGHGSVGEKLGHAFLIGVLIAASPFVWPFIAPMVPVVLAQ